MKKQIQDFSYYRLKLKDHLESSFPEKAGDAQFIEQRSRWAANAYEGAFRAGNAIEQCNKIADYILYENLHFSRYNTLFEVLSYEFAEIFDEVEYQDFALKILPACEEVFGHYELTDDFAYTTHYDLLYTELTGLIALWIQEHGIR